MSPSWSALPSPCLRRLMILDRGLQPSLDGSFRILSLKYEAIIPVVVQNRCDVEIAERDIGKELDKIVPLIDHAAA